MNSYSIHTRMLQKTVLLFIFLFSLQTKAQSVIEWPRTDQLPVHAENHMYQDREGYMWYGTIDGLCRDDGYTIETFSSRSYPALANNYILHITEDTKGRLWLGTKNGVYLLDKRTYRMSPLPELEIKNKTVTYLFTASDGRIYVGTKGFLLQYSSHGILQKAFDLHQNGDGCVNYMCEDTNGDLLLCLNGLQKLNIRTGHIQSFPFLETNTSSIVQDYTKRYYWIGTWGKGIIRFDPKASPEKMFRYEAIPVSFNSKNSPNILSIVQDDVFHYLWVTTMDNLFAFRILSDGRLQQIDTSTILPSGNKLLFKMLKDHRGNIWISAIDRKSFILTFNSGNIIRYPFPNPLRSLQCNPMVSSLCMDDNAVWFGLERFGLYLYDETTGTTVHYNDCPESQNYPFLLIKKIIRSHIPGKVWVMPDGATQLYGIQRKGSVMSVHDVVNLKKNNTSPGDIQTLFEDNSGRLWIGTTHELFVYNPQDGNLKKVLEAHSFISGITQTQDGTIWACCRNTGLYKIKEGHISLFPYRRDFTCLSTAPDGRLWLGTGQGDLLCFDKREKGIFIHFSEICGTQDNEVGSIRVDSYGYLWIVTNRTLQVFNPSNGMSRTYTISDSPIDMERFFPQAVSISADGTFYLGGVPGIIGIKPFSMAEKENHTQVHITSVKTGKNIVFMGNLPIENQYPQVELASDCRNISISFSSLDYLNAHSIRYAYRMEGIDKEWNYTLPGENTAFYNLLPKGKHIFEVKATDKDGIWSSSISKLTVHRLPFWYETRWAQTIYILLAISLMTIIYKILRKRYEQRNKQKLEERMTAYKSVLLPDESGTFRSPLTGTSEKDQAFADRLTALLEENIGNADLKVEDLASMMAMGRSAFFKKVKEITGFPPKEYLRIMRLNKASELLSNTDIPIAEVSFKVGISDPLYFSKCFKARFGVSPTAWQKDHHLKT